MGRRHLLVVRKNGEDLLKKETDTIPAGTNADFSVTALPRVIRIEPAGACNLHCIHCPTGTRTDLERGVMSKKVFAEIIKQLERYRCADVVVLYHGGEPFLNRNFFSMVRDLKLLGIRFIKTVTNGMMITPEMIEPLLFCGLDAIEFSLDGNSPDENDLIRRGAKYLQIVAIIKNLLEARRRAKAQIPEILIATTIIPDSRSFRSTDPIKTPNHLESEFEDFLGEIKFKTTYMIKWPGFECGHEFELLQPAKSEMPGNYCDLVIESTTIRWNGDVVPCCYDLMSEYVIGNIMNEPLESIWNNEQYRSLRESIHRRSFKPLCAHCNVVVPGTYVARRG